MIRRLFSITALLATLLVPLAANAGRVKDDYKGFREIFLKIVKRCPPSKCYYIGLGRSPTLLMAIFESVAPESSRNLPLSFGHEEIWDDVPTEKKRLLLAHLDAFLPSANELGKKRLVLIDYAATGTGLIKTAQLLQEFSQTRQRTLPKSLLVPMGQSGLIESMAKRLNYDVLPFTDLDFKRLSPDLMESLIDQSYDALAEYESFKIDKMRSEDLGPRREYADLKKTVREEIAKDRAMRAHPVRDPVPPFKAFPDALEVRKKEIRAVLQEIEQFEPLNVRLIHEDAEKLKRSLNFYPELATMPEITEAFGKILPNCDGNLDVSRALLKAGLTHPLGTKHLLTYAADEAVPLDERRTILRSLKRVQVMDKDSHKALQNFAQKTKQESLRALANEAIAKFDVDKCHTVLATDKLQELKQTLK